MFRKAANGTGQATLVYDGLGGNLLPDSFSPDGTQLVFREFSSGGDIHVLSLESELTSQPLLQEPFSESVASISPDGRWLAYTSDETGQYEVYVRPFPNVDENKFQISSGGGDEPRWGPDGEELFFLHETDDGDAEILMVTVTGEPVFSAGDPEVLFAGDYLTGNRPVWDISLDGQRFLLQKGQQVVEDESTALVVVDNWFEELNRLAPPSP